MANPTRQVRLLKKQASETQNNKLPNCTGCRQIEYGPAVASSGTPRADKTRSTSASRPPTRKSASRTYRRRIRSMSPSKPTDWIAASTRAKQRSAPSTTRIELVSEAAQRGTLTIAMEDQGSGERGVRDQGSGKVKAAPRRVKLQAAAEGSGCQGTAANGSEFDSPRDGLPCVNRNPFHRARLHTRCSTATARAN